MKKKSTGSHVATRPRPGRPGEGNVPSRRSAAAEEPANGRVVWLFDLDDTLHDAGRAIFGHLRVSMSAYIGLHLGVDEAAADALRQRYWRRYGATLLGLVRHHGVKPAHFLHHTHLLPGLEQRVRGHRHDLAALARLPGRKVLLTNAPAAYAARVLGALGIGRVFERIVAIDDMHMFGHLRPKPDVRMLRRTAARLHVPPGRCVLVEDTPGHLQAARRAGMGTVWMQRWTRARPAALRRCDKPPFVDLRIGSLQRLTRLR